MAPRIRLGRRTELPLYALGGYVLAGPILFLAGVQDLSSALRGPLLIMAIIAFLAGAVVHILDRIAQHNTEIVEKINDSVGDVYDTGVAAGERHRDLVAPDAQLAVVRDLSSPR